MVAVDGVHVLGVAGEGEAQAVRGPHAVGGGLYDGAADVATARNGAARVSTRRCRCRCRCWCRCWRWVWRRRRHRFVWARVRAGVLVALIIRMQSVCVIHFDCITRYRCLYSSQHSHLAVANSGLESGRECDAPHLPVLAAGGASAAPRRRSAPSRPQERQARVEVAVAELVELLHVDVA